jgi:hypothetical protein
MLNPNAERFDSVLEWNAKPALASDETGSVDILIKARAIEEVATVAILCGVIFQMARSV